MTPEPQSNPRLVWTGRIMTVLSGVASLVGISAWLPVSVTRWAALVAAVCAHVGAACVYWARGTELPDDGFNKPLRGPNTKPGEQPADTLVKAGLPEEAKTNRPDGPK